MSALLDPPTVKRDRTDSDAPRAKLSNLPYGTDEASVRSFIVSTNVAVTSLARKKQRPRRHRDAARRRRAASDPDVER